VDNAVMRYSEPRFTKDLDLLISVDKNNSISVYNALKEFGAPLENITAKDFSQEGYFYQMGVQPLRVDILMSIQGVNFDEAWKHKKVIQLGDIEINFISKKHAQTPLKRGTWTRQSVN
jgi:hypothetical protein